MKNFEDCAADTSTLISLTRGDAIDCLGDIFRKVYIPEEVARECLDPKTKKAIRKPLFEVRKVKNILPVNIHKGELETISLAVELGISVILANDLKAINKAFEYGLEPMPVSDILVLSKREGFIKSAKKTMDTMKANGEGIAKEIYFEILKEVGEL